MCEQVSEDWWRHLGEDSRVKFDSIEDLENFWKRCSKHMESVESINSDWDLAEIPTKFYSAYEENKQNGVRDFEQLFCDNKTCDPENGCDSICVGKAFKLKKLLCKEFEATHVDLGDKLYMASTATDTLLDKNDILSVEKIDPDVYKNLNVHCTLALKIQLKNRMGFLFFEFVLYNNKPAIVMEDNLPPSTLELDLPYNRVSQFRCVQSTYIFSVIKTKHSLKATFIFIAYVKRAFLRPDLAMRYYSLFFIKFPIIFKSRRVNGRVTVGVILKPKENSIKIQTLDASSRKSVVEVFKFDYFNGGKIVHSIEKAIECAALSFDKDPTTFKKDLELMCRALLDKSFAKNSMSLMNYIRNL